jgi:hypothetical protein
MAMWMVRSAGFLGLFKLGCLCRALVPCLDRIKKERHPPGLQRPCHSCSPVA